MAPKERDETGEEKRNEANQDLKKLVRVIKLKRRVVLFVSLTKTNEKMPKSTESSWNKGRTSDCPCLNLIFARDFRIIVVGHLWTSHLDPQDCRCRLLAVPTAAFAVHQVCPERKRPNYC